MIPADDLKISVKYDHAGGQQAGTPPSNIVVEHLPTGLIAIVPAGRGSQFRAKNVAIRMIEQALTDPEFRAQ
jgi:protein subunit release factor A